MAKKPVKPAKKAAKPATKKPVAKPAKKISKPAPKKAVKPVAKKTAKPTAKKVVKPVKPAPKKAVKPTKPAPKKAVKPVAKKVVKPAKPTPKKVIKPAKPIAKKVEKSVAKPTKPAKELVKAKVKGKPIDAIAKKGGKANKKGGKANKKAKKSSEDEEEDDDFEDEEEDDADVDVEDEYEKADEDEGGEVELDEAPMLDLEGGGVIDDDDEDEIPEKRGRGRRKKNEGKSSGIESYIRNRPLHIDITKPLIKKVQADQPKPFVNTKDNRSRYSDKELAEFKELIIGKLKEAQADYDLLKLTLSNADNHGTDDTSPTFKLLEDGSDVLSKEETAQLANRQEKYIVNLKNALMRIENKTYGICRVTGKLIPKERLRSVPHATLGIDAKLNQSN